MVSSRQCAILGRALIRNVLSAFSKLSTPPSPAEWEWGFRFADLLSLPMAAACGQRRMNLAARYFSSPCPPSRERSVKAPVQTLFIDRLAKVADDPVVQGADPVN